MASNQVLIGNGRLPFDVLIRVFELYLPEETPDHPLESLLLVCKAWEQAAVAHRSLWATFKITMGEEEHTRLWLCRLPLRIERSGLQALFHIDIRHLDEETGKQASEAHDRGQKIPTQADVEANLPRILDLLAGVDGHLCARWGSLRLTIYGCFLEFRATDPHRNVFNSLTYPMPSLTSLHLALHSDTDVWLFPQLPAVESIVLEHSELHDLPDMSHAQNIWIGGELLCMADGPLWFLTAPEVLHLRIEQGFWLDDAYPKLHTLSLYGRYLPPGFEETYIPRLRVLDLHFTGLDILEDLLYHQQVLSLLDVVLLSCEPSLLTDPRERA
ncbi:hypothetical protein FRC17_007954, partial [Serendipita sp. 399]